MLGFLKGDPKKKLKKAYEDKLAKALHAQRNGDLRTHGTLMEEAEKIYGELQALEKEGKYRREDGVRRRPSSDPGVGFGCGV